MKIKCLIVEDEPVAQIGLTDFICQIPFLELVSVCDDALDALTVLSQQKVDLIFLDVQMPKLNGLDFMRSLKETPLVILTTAYPEYALQGYEHGVVDYLVKPIPFDRFIRAVNKAQKQVQVLQAEHSTEIIFVKTNKKLERLFLGDLLYIEAMAHYVVFHTSLKKYIVYCNLKTVEQQLPVQFIKVHKSYIVSLEKIESIDQEGVLISGSKIPVSKNFREHLLQVVKSKSILRL